VGNRVALVSCVKSKRAAASPARDLYTSHLFRGLRAYAEARADAWYILSAQHGLVHPDAVIGPYEKTLGAMPKRDRTVWAHRVQAQLIEILPSGAELILLAGLRYREGLESFLRKHGFSVSIPMEGLAIGKQLQWLNRALMSTHVR
jgi:hypothetical protein